MRRHALRAATWFASVLLLAGLALPAGAQTTTVVGTPEERTAAIVRPAVVYVEQHFKAWVRVPRGSELFFQGYVNDGNPFEWATRCSGFVVNPTGYIVSAGHCVDLSEEGARSTALELATQWLINSGWAYQQDYDYWLSEGHLAWGVEGTERGSEPDREVWVQRGVAAGGLRTGEAFPARVVDYQPWSQGDIALLKVEEADLPTVLIAQGAEVTIGTEVLSIGYPGSSDAVTDATLEPTYKDGQINSEKTREGGLLPVYEMSAALSGGMSGGPTANLDGEVVGVNSFGISGETEAFNFISPASLVTEMLARNGVSNTIGPIDEAYRAGIDAYFSGDYQTAIERFDQVLALAPTHQQAQEYRVEASRLAAENPPPADEGAEPARQQPTSNGEGSFPLWAIALVVVGVLAAGALSLLAMRRRPSPAAPAAAAPVPIPSAPEPTPLRAVEPTEQGTTRFCSNCGHRLGAEARFCPSCGHTIEAA
jgi:S1-C subfamily serine protease